MRCGARCALTVQDVLSLMVLSRSSSSALSELTLAEGEVVDVRIRACWVGSKRVRFQALLASLQSPRPGVYRIGWITLRGVPAVGTLPATRVNVCAALTESSMVAVPTKRYSACCVLCSCDRLRCSA